MYDVCTNPTGGGDGTREGVGRGAGGGGEEGRDEPTRRKAQGEEQRWIIPRGRHHSRIDIIIYIIRRLFVPVKGRKSFSKTMRAISEHSWGVNDRRTPQN